MDISIRENCILNMRYVQILGKRLRRVHDETFLRFEVLRIKNRYQRALQSTPNLVGDDLGSGFLSKEVTRYCPRNGGSSNRADNEVPDRHPIKLNHLALSRSFRPHL